VSIVSLLLSAEVDVVAGQAPAFLAPPPLPSDSASYGASGVVFGVILQARADIPEDDPTPNSFSLRKAELGLRARVGPATHLSLEMELTRRRVLCAGRTCA
jgi:hypothetical protein